MFKSTLIKEVASREKVTSGFLRKQLAAGRAVLLFNNAREKITPLAIGEGMKIKINANIGLSTKEVNEEKELAKALTAVEYGADTIMDLSVGGDTCRLRRKILDNTRVPLGTVPIYEAVLEVQRRKGRAESLTFDDLWDVLCQQAREGVDFFTIHAGILYNFVKDIRLKKRTCGIVSRGGALLARWMLFNKKENILFDNFDKILDLAKRYNITLSLGDALRPGAIDDSTDKAQISELKVLGGLVKKARKRGVQVMVEGPGHIRYDEIPFNVKVEKKFCYSAPFYVLGPLPVDDAAGYDHIASAIGGALAGFAGADFLCVVTPAEHLRHPDESDIKEGVMASRIAAHCINSIRFKDEWQINKKISVYRARRDWDNIFKFVLDAKKARFYRKGLKNRDDICTMCGDFCSLKIAEKCKLIK